MLTMMLAPALPAQQPDSIAPAPKIQDNSFLIEEAYNQETGVVQHIGTYQVRRGSSDFDFAFTQEWPVRSIRHQLSYDVPLVRTGSKTGIGDLTINYRYQLTGDGNARLAVAPRISAILPTGDWKRSMGNGGAGIDVNFPVSYVLSPLAVTHFNLGGALIPSARNALGAKAGISEWTVGESLILTVTPVIQPMLEVIYTRGREVLGDDRTGTFETFLISPGVRGAINFPSGLQIVPGISIPFGAGPSSGERGVFVYLSVEHSFSR